MRPQTKFEIVDRLRQPTPSFWKKVKTMRHHQAQGNLQQKAPHREQRETLSKNICQFTKETGPQLHAHEIFQIINVHPGFSRKTAFWQGIQKNVKVFGSIVERIRQDMINVLNPSQNLGKLTSQTKKERYKVCWKVEGSKMERSTVQSKDSSQCLPRRTYVHESVEYFTAEWRQLSVCVCWDLQLPPWFWGNVRFTLFVRMLGCLCCNYSWAFAFDVRGVFLCGRCARFTVSSATLRFALLSVVSYCKVCEVVEGSGVSFRIEDLAGQNRKNENPWLNRTSGSNFRMPTKATTIGSFRGREVRDKEKSVWNHIESSECQGCKMQQCTIVLLGRGWREPTWFQGPVSPVFQSLPTPWDPWEHVQRETARTRPAETWRRVNCASRFAAFESCFFPSPWVNVSAPQRSG